MTAEFFHRTDKVKCGFVSRCKTCSAEYSKWYAKVKPEARNKWYAANRESQLEYKKLHRKENLEHYLKVKAIWNSNNREHNKAWFAKYHQDRKNTQEYKNYCEKYRLENSDKLKELSKRYREKNKQRISEDQARRYEAAKDVRKTYIKNYRIENPHKRAAWNAAYRAAKIQRTPKWLTDDDKFLIQEIYHLSNIRSKLTGVPWEVDHILPLKGRRVSGLHVPENLQVIPQPNNNKKRNKFAPGDYPVKTNFFGV